MYMCKRFKSWRKAATFCSFAFIKYNITSTVCKCPTTRPLNVKPDLRLEIKLLSKCIMYIVVKLFIYGIPTPVCWGKHTLNSSTKLSKQTVIRDFPKHMVTYDM